MPQDYPGDKTDIIIFAASILVCIGLVVGLILFGGL